MNPKPTSRVKHQQKQLEKRRRKETTKTLLPGFDKSDLRMQSWPEQGAFSRVWQVEMGGDSHIHLHSVRSMMEGGQYGLRGARQNKTEFLIAHQKKGINNQLLELTELERGLESIRNPVKRKQYFNRHLPGWIKTERRNVNHSWFENSRTFDNRYWLGCELSSLSFRTQTNAATTQNIHALAERERERVKSWEHVRKLVKEYQLSVPANDRRFLDEHIARFYNRAKWLDEVAEKPSLWGKISEDYHAAFRKQREALSQNDKRKKESSN